MSVGNAVVTLTTWATCDSTSVFILERSLLCVQSVVRGSAMRLGWRATDWCTVALRALFPVLSVAKVSLCYLDLRDTNGCTPVRAHTPVHSVAGALRSWGTYTPTRGSTAEPRLTAASSVDAASAIWVPTRATAAPQRSNQPGWSPAWSRSKCMSTLRHGADCEMRVLILCGGCHFWKCCSFWDVVHALLFCSRFSSGVIRHSLVCLFHSGSGINSTSYSGHWKKVQYSDLNYSAHEVSCSWTCSIFLIKSSLLSKRLLQSSCCWLAVKDLSPVATHLRLD